MSTAIDVPNPDDASTATARAHINTLLLTASSNTITGMAADISSSYDDTHRAFLQALVARGTLTFTQSKPLLSSILSAASPDDQTILPGDITPADLSSYISAVNGAISPFDMEIRSTLPQDPNTSSSTRTTPASAPDERVYALVNTTSDPITQLATSRTPDELAFLKRVLDAMFDGPPGNTRRAEVFALTPLQTLALSRPSAAQQQQTQTQTQTQDDSATSTAAATAAAAQAGLTKAEAERVMDGLVAEGWMDLSRKGYFRLSARALMELRTWLVETYNDEDDGDGGDDGDRRIRVRSCAGCGEIVIVGQRCGDLDCKIRVHDVCLRNVLRAAGTEEACPGCARRWTGDVFVGEKAALVGGRRSTTDASVDSRRRSSQAAVPGQNEDEED